MDTKIKSSVLKSIMNNPSLKRTIIDSLNAPLGSTKRTKAKSILSAFSKISSNRMDGQGGPSVITANPANFNFNPGATLQTPSYNNIRIFPVTPDPKPTTTIGNWSNLSQPSLSPNASFGNTPFNINQSIAPNLQQITSNYPTQPSTLNPNASVVGKTSPFTTVTPTAQSNLLSKINQESGQSPLVGVNPTTFGQSVGKGTLQSLMSTLNSLNHNVVVPATIKSTAPATLSNGASPAITSETATPTTGITEGPTNNLSTTLNYSGDAAIQAQWNSLSPSDQQKYKPVFDAAYNKLGAGTFFYGAMSDKNTLKQMFPGLKDEDLPTGASLAGQMADLQKTLKTQYGLDDLLKQKTQLANETKTFTQDMSDYISGKDQMMGQINKMIDDAEAKSVNISTPAEAKTMNNYLNYLYTLKGRQNKNYTDYLNQAITYQNDKVTQVDGEYTNMVNAYNTDFKTQSDIKTADYNQWYTVLTDMYNKLDGSLGAQLDLQQKQADLDKTYAGIAIDAANANAKTSNLNITQNPTIKDMLIDSTTANKGQLLPGIDLASVLANAQNEGLDPQGVLNTYQLGAKSSISAGGANIGSLNMTINDITNTLRNFNTTTQGQYKNIVSNIAQGLGQQTEYSLDSYISGNPTAIVVAIKDLGSKKNTNVSDFVKNHPNLDAGVAKQLFNYYKANPEYANKPQMLFSSTGKISESDIPQIKSTIAKSIGGSWANDLVTAVNQY